MEKQGQKVIWERGSENYAKILGQTVANIVIDDEGYAFGDWKGRLVGSFSINSGEWHVM